MKVTLFKSLQFRLPFLVLLAVVPTTIIAIALASANASKIIHQDIQNNLALRVEALDSKISGKTEMNLLAQEIDQTNFAKTGYGLVVNEKGNILINPNSASGNKLANYSSYPPVANLFAGQEGYFSFTDKTGMEWVSHGIRLDNGWGVFVLQQKSEAFLQEKDFQKSAALIAGIAMVIIGTITWLVAKRLTQPISHITKAATKVAEGNLGEKIKVEQEDEIGILANSFNKKAQQLQTSITSLEAQANEQRQEKEKLESAIFTLIDEVADATEGDLTVRANLDSMELSTVADLFNAIIDNLQEIAIEAQQSTSQVGSSLRRNETEMRFLAEKAIAEAEETRNTLMSVEQLSHSIQAVATNANQAEQIADDTYNTIVNSTNNMDLTVESILTLRTTVSETVKKMKRLDESSHKISEAVSLIEAIALKTNVLAINAGAEADRAGEYGQGFAIVAEQVSLLAKQSSAALQEIARTVTLIQAETEEVNQAMTSGNDQVLETSRLVESTKETLGSALEKSRKINQLMESISQSTISQTTTSQNVTDLMQKIAQLSETTSLSSKRVARSIVETANVAEKLESTVSQFKVAKSA